jgi:ABC-type sugar transport system ATPase subunit
MDRKPYLVMSRISKTYPGVKALRQVSLEVRKGEVHALVGENGAGKSTLIKILAGVVRPDPGGTIEIEGKPVEFASPLDALRQGISVNYQDLSLFPNLSVAENIALGHSGGIMMNWKAARRIARDALQRLGVDLEIDTPLETLSIAKQQLVSIARAISFEARLLVLDEPTSSLSSNEAEQLFRIIRDLKESGISILFVSHKFDELFAVADRFTVLRDGEYVGSYDRSEIDEGKLIALMVGRSVEYEKQVPDEPNPGEVVLDVRGLGKKGQFKDIHFRVRAGEIVGITGLVGAGRTELAQALFGIETPDEGEIRLGGEPVRIRSTREAVEMGIAYIPESRQTQGLVLQQTIARNITLAVLRRLAGRFRLLDVRREREIADAYMTRLDVRPRLPEMTADQLSGGNQQKVVVAKWLAASPRLLIVDEPTNGIDIGAKTEIHRLLRELANQNMAVLMISSELPEVLAVCDRILVMRRGRLVGEFANRDATQVDIMNRALLGAPLTFAAGEGTG